jgi:hypothetical protein
MKSILPLIAFLFFTNCLIGQKSLSDGWVVTNNGDTLFGKIEEKEWNANPSKISFYKNVKIEYAISELKSFGLNDDEVYRRYTVIRHLIPYREGISFPEDDKKTDTITVWLRMIVQSELSLAALYQADRPYFYVIDNFGQVTELIASKGVINFSQEKYKNDSRYGKSLQEVEDFTFKNQINSLFNRQIKTGDLELLSYNEASLENIFLRYNHVNTGKRGNATFYIGINGGVSSFSSKSGADAAGAVLFKSEFKTAVSPFFKLSFHFQGKRKISRMSFVPELGLSTFNTSGKKTSVGTEGEFLIRNTYLEIGAMTVVRLNPLSSQNFFVAVGADAYLKLSGENTYISYNNGTTNKPVQHKFFIAPFVSTGYLFSNIGIFVNYQLLGEQTDYISSKWKVNRASTGVSYYFKKKNTSKK